jgi:serine/threonine protein kinase
MAVPAESLAWEAIMAANLSDPSYQPITIAEHSGSNPQHAPAQNARIVGSIIGEYQVIAVQEQTAYTTRYRAAHIDNPSHLVTLDLFPFTTSDNKVLQRFQVSPAIQFATRGHPNIPVPIEAGKTDDGQPYVVVEAVNGLPIDLYCDTLQLKITERLYIFASVCDIIHSAHKYAAIHGDLKPTNILVIDTGKPMIISFGIADLYNAGSNLNTLDQHWSTKSKTVIDDLTLDLDFASPEQLASEPMSTAVDIYALGVILYRLLTGHSPYRLQSSSRTEISQAIIEQIPEKPSKIVAQLSVQPDTSLEAIATSRATSLPRLQQMLSGDLDAIVLMTLRKEPERRYASAHQLAEDIRAFLRFLPVDARFDSRIYRLTHFARRHVALIVVNFMILLTLSMALVVTSTALTSTRQERDQTNTLSIEARRTIDQLYTNTARNRLLDQFNLRPLRKTLLEDAERFYQAILDHPPTQLENPTELAEAAARLAKLATIIGPQGAAIPKFERAHSLWEELVAREPANQQYQQQLATLLVDFATTLTPLEPTSDRAHLLLNQAQKLSDALVAANPQSIPVRRQQATILLAQALNLDKDRHPNDAMTAIAHALAIYNHLAPNDPDILETQLSIANAHAYAAFIFASQPAEQVEAIAAYNSAIETRQRILTSHPDFDEQAHRLAVDQNSLANCFQRTGQTEFALQAFRRSLELFDRLQQRYPDVRPFQLGKATASTAIADLLRQHNEITEAFTLARNAQATLLHLHAKYPQDATVRLQLAKSHNIIGRLNARTGNKSEAIHLFQQAIDLYEIMISDLDPSSIYELACNVALCIPLISQSPPKAPSEFSARSLERRCGFYMKRAVEVLQLARHAHFLNPDMLESNSDFDPLRQDPAFQQLVKDIQNQSSLRAK